VKGEFIQQVTDIFLREFIDLAIAMPISQKFYATVQINFIFNNRAVTVAEIIRNINDAIEAKTGLPIWKIVQTWPKSDVEGLKRY
jgi:hypothetical protein